MFSNQCQQLIIIQQNLIQNLIIKCSNNKRQTHMPERNQFKAYLKTHKNLKAAIEDIKNTYYLRAKMKLNQLLQIQPDHANALYLYSVCLEEEGRIQESSVVKQKCIELNPCYYKSFNLDKTNLMKNMLQNLKDTLKNTKQLNNASTMTWVDVINIYSRYMDLDSCLKIMTLFEKIKKPNSAYSSYIFSNFGLTYYELGFYHESLSHYQTAISMTNDEFRYYNNSGILCYILGEYGKGVELVNKSLELRPGYAKSLFILSFSLAKMDRATDALTKIMEASSMSPQSTLYRFKIITLLLTYFPGEDEQANKQLKGLAKIMEEKTDDDKYFYNKENIPLLEEASKFMLQNYKYREGVKQDWKTYIQLLDDYLIRGHSDKYRITIKMNELKKKIDSDLASLNNQSSLPEELLQSF